MGRVLIALAAAVSLTVLLFVVLAPVTPAPAALVGDTPAEPSTPPPAPMLAIPARKPAPSEAQAEAPVEEEIEEDALHSIRPEDAPPDPVERGECTLVLTLSSDADETPLDTQVELWRIGEPGNEHWTAGDRRIASEETKDGRLTVRRLAAGRYRIHAHGQRKGSDDSGAFPVRGAETEVALALPTPRRFRVRLRVYDEAGRFVERGQKQAGGSSSYFRSGGGPPAWVERRRLREGFLSRGMSMGSGCGSGGRRGAKVFVEAWHGTFDISTMRESERRRSWSRTWHLHPYEGSTVSLYARSDTARDCVFVGATVRMAELYAAIRLPDGRRAIDAGASISARCSAVLVKEDGIEPDWRRIPIEVRVRLDGYAKLDFQHTLDGPVLDRVLEPAAP